MRRRNSDSLWLFLLLFLLLPLTAIGWQAAGDGDAIGFHHEFPIPQSLASTISSNSDNEERNSAASIVPSTYPHYVEGYVSIGTDSRIHLSGRGRRSSKGISITHGVSDAFFDSDAKYSADPLTQPLHFDPTIINLGDIETCYPEITGVHVTNRGMQPVRLASADFSRDSFSLLTDFQNLQLGSGESVMIKFTVLASEPEGDIDASLRVVIADGLAAFVPIRGRFLQNAYQLRGLRESIPIGSRFEQTLHFYNPSTELIHVTEVFYIDGLLLMSFPHINNTHYNEPLTPTPNAEELQAGESVWDVPSGATKPIATVSLVAEEPGDVFTHIRVVARTADDWRQFLIPVRLQILPEGVHVEPQELDLGVSVHSQEEQTASITIYNVGVSPVIITELHVLEAENVDLSARLLGPATIPPRARVQRALEIIACGKVSGGWKATLVLRTNESVGFSNNKDEREQQRTLQLIGKVINGTIAIKQDETSMGVSIPLTMIVRSGDKFGYELLDSASIYVPTTFYNYAETLAAGSFVYRSFSLQNMFDTPVELQRVWLPTQNDEVELHQFTPGVVAPGDFWHAPILRVKPALHRLDDLALPRNYEIVVETNATVHRAYYHLYHGILHLQSSSGLQNHETSGYSFTGRTTTTNKKNDVKANHTCRPALPIDDDVLSGDVNVEDIKICRSWVFDLGKVAFRATRTEILVLTNLNPIPIKIRTTEIINSNKFDVSINASMSPTPQVPISTAEFGIAWAQKLSQSEQSNQSDQSGNSAPTTQDSRLGTIKPTEEFFSLLPGYSLALEIGLQIKNHVGNLTSYLMTIETEFEILHVHMRCETVKGTVIPQSPQIMLPPTFPGRAMLVEINYRNSFPHAIKPVSVHFPSAYVQLVELSHELIAHDISRGLTVVFSPAYVSACSTGNFFADCFLPLSWTNQSVSSSVNLSQFGKFVTVEDTEAFRHRNALWQEIENASEESRLMIHAEVRLLTDIMDVDTVTLSAPLIRPIVTASTKYEFPLTKIQQINLLYVQVRNPSNFSVNMQLAVAESDQPLFYSCERGETELECVREWKRLNSRTNGNASSISTGYTNKSPPLFVYSNTIKVPPNHSTELGPIYFFPTTVQEIATTLYVRNELTHIEPVTIIARSGKGELDIQIPMNDEPQSSNSSAYGVKGVYDGVLAFVLTLDQDDSSTFIQQNDVVLTNVGTFPMKIESIHLDEDYSDASPFTLQLQRQPERVEAGTSQASITLAPVARLFLQVTFHARCSLAKVERDLIIRTSDGSKRLALVGTITPPVSAACVRSVIPLGVLHLFRNVWLLSAVVAIFFVIYVVYVAVVDVAFIRTREMSTYAAEQSIFLRDSMGEMMRGMVSSEDGALSEASKELQKRLATMEAISFTPDTRVTTPAVSQLLEQRQKAQATHIGTSTALFESSSVRSNESVADKANDILLVSGQRQVETAMSARAKETIMKKTSDTLAVDQAQQESKVSTPRNKHASGTDKTSNNSLHTKSSNAKHIDKERKRDESTQSEKCNGLRSSSVKQLSSQPLKLSKKKTKNSSVDIATSASSTISKVRSSSLHSNLAVTSIKFLESKKKSSSPSSNDGFIEEDPVPALNLFDNEAESLMSSKDKPLGLFAPFGAITSGWRDDKDKEAERNKGERLPLASRSTVNGIDEEWEQLSFDSIRFEIGKLVGNEEEKEEISSRATNNGFHQQPASIDFSAASLAPPTGLLLAVEPTTNRSTMSTKQAPPGFTPADANPVESLAAFDRLRGVTSDIGGLAFPRTSSFPNRSIGSASPFDPLGTSSTFSSLLTSTSSSFESRFSLFGPSLSSPTTSRINPASAVGRIGSGRSTAVAGEEEGSRGYLYFPRMQEQQHCMGAVISAASRVNGRTTLEPKALPDHDTSPK